MSRRRNKKYSKVLKLKAIQDYLSGKGSYETQRKKHELQSTKQLRDWVKWYNGHKEFKEHRGFGMEIYMTKGRKTTQQERTEIVAYCIEHGKDYPLTIQTYDVSYQQISEQK
jgi:Transposase.